MNSMKLPKVIFFDLDGVILDSEIVYLELLLNYNNKNNMPLTKAFYISYFLGKTRKDIDNYYKEKYGDEYDSKKYWDELNKCREEYLLNNKIKVKEGFLDLKEYLKNNGIFIGVVTSNSLELTKKLFNNAKLDINDFDFIITREDVFNTKPNSDLYLKAIEHFGFANDSYIAIEDSNVGITSAMNANIRVIYLKDIDILKPELKDNCFKCVESLHEIIDILKEMK